MKSRNTFSHADQYGELSERELVAVIAQMAELLDFLPKNEPEIQTASVEANRVLTEARTLMTQAAQSTSATTTTRNLSRDDFEVLIFYHLEAKFRKAMTTLVGPFRFKNKTMEFGEQTESEWKPNSHAIGTNTTEERKMIAASRHWLYHHSEKVDTMRVLECMRTMLNHPTLRSWSLAQSDMISDLLDFIHKAETCLGCNAATLSVELELEIRSNKMTIPIEPPRHLIGRQAIVDATLQKLKQVGSCVLLHGLPGVGKDAIAATVAAHKEIQEMDLGSLQAWFTGSTEDGFCRQLVGFFQTQSDILKGTPSTLFANQAWPGVTSFRFYFFPHSLL